MLLPIARRIEMIVVATTAIVLGMAEPAMAATQAGVAAAISGQVTVIPEDHSSERAAVGGMPIYVQDTIRSGEASQMQVMLLDETVLTVGPNTEIQVDDMIFDPAAMDKSKLTARVSKGTFSYISGAIATAHPENVEIKVPVGTIGVRGTSIFAVEEPGTGKTFVGLLGPGPRNDGNLHPGGFTISNEQGTAEVLRSGFGVSVAPNQAPGPVTQIPQELLTMLTNNLRNPQVREQGGGQNQGKGAGSGNVENNSGQTSANAQGGAARIASIDSVKSALADDTANKTQNQVINQAQGDFPAIPRLSGFNDAIPAGVILPLAIQLSWNQTSGPLVDFELHVTGPNGDGTRFHLDGENTLGSFGHAPFVRIDGDNETGSGGTVAAFNGLTTGSNYRASVFADTGRNTDFAPANNVAMSVIQNGVINRGANDSSSISGGKVIRIVTPPSNQTGNVWTAIEIDPTTRKVITINTLSTVSNSNQVQ